jgi:hypothetical protein
MVKNCASRWSFTKKFKISGDIVSYTLKSNTTLEYGGCVYILPVN